VIFAVVGVAGPSWRCRNQVSGTVIRVARGGDSVIGADSAGEIETAFLGAPDVERGELGAIDKRLPQGSYMYCSAQQRKRICRWISPTPTRTPTAITTAMLPRSLARIGPDGFLSRYRRRLQRNLVRHRHFRKVFPNFYKLTANVPSVPVFFPRVSANY